MGGAGYTMRNRRLATTFSVVAGAAWNHLRIAEEVRNSFSAADNDVDATLDRASFVIRPGVAVSVRIAPRLDVVGFGGYLFNRPEFTIRTLRGEVQNEWTTDAVVVSAGMVIEVF